MQYRNLILKDARRIKGLTQTELAKKTKLSVGCVNLVELGKAPWLKSIRRICKVLGVRLEDVVIREAESEDDKSRNRRKAS